MTAINSRLGKRVIALTGVAVTAATAVGAGLWGATPAQADPQDWPTVTVAANGGLAVRVAPSTSAPKFGAIPDKTKVLVSCQINGTSVGGTTKWYLVNPGSEEGGFVSSKFIKEKPKLPMCALENQVRAVNAVVDVNRRQGPSTNDKLLGYYKAGSELIVSCKVESQRAEGSKTWYRLANGKGWVSSSALEGKAPDTCYS